MGFENEEDLDNLEKLIPYISNHLDWRELLIHCDFFSYEEKQHFKMCGDYNGTSPIIVEQILQCFLQKKVFRNRRKRLQQIMICMGNKKISNLLETKRLPKPSENKMKINGKLPEICERLRVEVILAYLKSKDVINIFDEYAIRSKLTAEGNWVAAFELMFRLSRRETHWFGRFVEALVETHQSHLAEEIDNAMFYKIRSDETKSAFENDDASCSGNSFHANNEDYRILCRFSDCLNINEGEIQEKREVRRERKSISKTSSKLSEKSDKTDENPSRGSKSEINIETASETETSMIGCRSKSEQTSIGKTEFERRLEFWRQSEKNEKETHSDREKIKIKRTKEIGARKNTLQWFPAVLQNSREPSSEKRETNRRCLSSRSNYLQENGLDFMSFCERFSNNTLSDLSDRNTRRNAICLSPSDDNRAAAEIDESEDFHAYCNRLPLESRFRLLRTNRKRHAVRIRQFQRTSSNGEQCVKRTTSSSSETRSLPNK